MNKCVIVGGKKAGKTTLLMQIAAGVTGKSQLTLEVSPGRSHSRTESLRVDWRQFDQEPAETREIHKIVLPLRAGHSSQQQMWALYDTPALNDSISTDYRARQAVADVFRLLFSCRAVLHVVDVSRVGQHRGSGGLSEADRGIYWLMSHKDKWSSLRKKIMQADSPKDEGRFAGYRAMFHLFGNNNNGNHNFGASNPSYCVVANKMNLPWARVGKQKLTEELSGTTVLTGPTRRQSTMRRIRDFLFTSSKMVDA